MAQIPQIAAQSSNGSTVTVYRLGDHVDITRGPLISTTHQLGRFSVTAVSDPVTRGIMVREGVREAIAPSKFSIVRKLLEKFFSFRKIIVHL